MGSQKNSRPVPDALVFRETADGSVWDVRQVPAHRLAAFLEGGWTLLISSSQVDAVDLEDTYNSDKNKPFNPPRKPQG